MSRLIEWRFMNIGKVRREMGHIKCAGHGCVDGAVFTSAMPLRDQPDLLNSLSPGLRFQNCIDCIVNCHGSAQAGIEELPGNVVGDVARDPTQRVFDELLVDLKASRETA